MWVDNSEVEGGGREGVAGNWDHMIRRGGFHVAVYVEPNMVGGSLSGRSGQSLLKTVCVCVVHIHVCVLQSALLDSISKSITIVVCCLATKSLIHDIPRQNSI